MPSNSSIILRSIRRWVLAAVFLLGVGLIVLAHTGYTLSGSVDGPIFATAGVIGGVVALGAGLKLLGSLAPRSKPNESG